MDILPSHFQILRYHGLWYPSYEKFGFLKIIYTYIVVLSIFSSTLSQLINLSSSHGDVKDVTENLFVSMSFTAFCLKVINFLYRKKEMNTLLTILRSDFCRTKTPKEEEIILDNQNMNSKIHKILMVLALFTELLFFILPLWNVLKFGGTQLPTNGYYPYSLENRMNYIATFIYQVFSFHFAVLLNVTLDLLPCALMSYTCAQFALSKHRFLSAMKNKISEAIKQYVAHQITMRVFVDKLQRFFITAILPLFLITLIVVCSSIFQLTQSMEEFGVDTVRLIMYLVCMLNLVFVYCWFGNELQLKSVDIAETVYQYDWTDLKLADRKCLYFIMIWGQKEKTISFHGLCSMTLQTYAWILKTSYTAFNLLKSVND